MEPVETKDQVQPFIHKLSNLFVSFFDVYCNETIGSTPVDLFAIYKRRDEKYLMTKTMKVWGVETQQCVFVTTAKTPLTDSFLFQFEEDIRLHIQQYIPEKQDHMSTGVAGLVVTDQPVPESYVKGVMKYRRLKFFKYGLHGWAELYLGIVDLRNECVYIHPKGRSYVKPILSMFEKEEGKK